MNLRQLRTLAAFLEQRSFAATGDRIGLSHSAISVQMQRLEEELGADLFDRTSRPPTITHKGVAIAEIARDILDLVDRMRRMAQGQLIATTISIGFVPTTLTFVLPSVLKRLRSAYPALQIGIKSGLSGELAAAVMRRELDFALISSPVVELPELTVTEIAREPLLVIGPCSLHHIRSEIDLTIALPFIAFNKRTWLGQQIAAQLQSRGIHVREGMEVDSLDAIELLVSEGFGVSIVPQRLLAPPLSDKLAQLPFGSPAQTRRLVLVEHREGRQTQLETTVRSIFQSLAA